MVYSKTIKIIKDFKSLIIDFPLIWKLLISVIYKLLGKTISKRVISYVFVGFSGVGVQTSITYILLSLTNYSFRTILPISVFIATCSNFTINNVLTFSSKKLVGVRFLFGLIKFLLISSLPMMINIFVARFLYIQLLKSSFLAQLCGIFVSFIWNYLLSSKLIWEKKF